MPQPAVKNQDPSPETAREETAEPRSPFESAAQRRAFYEDAATVTLRGTGPGEAAGPSPARQMQAALDAEYSRSEDEERLPLRWTFAMVLGVCGAFWTMVYFVVAALIG
ncbi:hypothetical protein [Parvularcula oceani]|uniref:hypothetical protein n=1 Tax=Parvularcula oceani TaxID=1247963 RepID=UPI0004E24E34|nr:hypothetical protein [Parvularcula oceani]